MGRKGFTFLEVMVALAIISGLMVTVLTALTSNIGAAGRLRNEITAANLAWEKLEGAKLEGCLEKDGSSGGPTGFQWTCVDEDEPYLPGIRRLTVTVAWDKKNVLKLDGYKRSREASGVSGGG